MLKNVKQMFNFLKILIFLLIQTNVSDMIRMKEGVRFMRKKLINVGVVILFYSVIIFGVILLNYRMSYLNKLDNTGSNVTTLNN